MAITYCGFLSIIRIRPIAYLYFVYVTGDHNFSLHVGQFGLFGRLNNKLVIMYNIAIMKTARFSRKLECSACTLRDVCVFTRTSSTSGSITSSSSTSTSKIGSARMAKSSARCLKSKTNVAWPVNVSCWLG